MSIAPTEDGSAFAGHVTDMRTFGVTTYSTPSGNGFGIGFMRILEGFLRDDVVVNGPLVEIH